MSETPGMEEGPRSGKRIQNQAASLFRAIFTGRSAGWIVLRMIIPVGLVALAAYVPSTGSQDDTNFSIQAVTRSIRVDVTCDDILRWDLPTGAVKLPGKNSPETFKRGMLTLRGGTRATIRVTSDGRLDLQLERSPAINCPTYDVDAIRMDIDPLTHLLSNDVTSYRSEPLDGSGSAAAGAPTFIIKGRIVLGQQIMQGGGWSNDDGNLLFSGSVDARTPDTFTNQKRLIHAEQIEPGSEVDSHACLNRPADELGKCLKASVSKAQGFLFFSGDARRDAAISAQVSVVGKSIGVRQFGGTQREVMVTRWSKWITSSYLQLIFALVVGVSALSELGNKVIGFFELSKKGWGE